MMHGRRVSPRTLPAQRRCLREAIRPIAVVAVAAEAVSRDQARDRRLDRGQDVRHVSLRETRGRVKREAPVRCTREHPVEHERVDVDVQIERSPKSILRAARAAGSAVRAYGRCVGVAGAWASVG
jgi:hypothetical protein